jgi:hypothetical protein
MELNKLTRFQSILVLNWLILPALALWIWVSSGFFNVILFGVVWWITDSVWNWLSNFFLDVSGKVSAKNMTDVFGSKGRVPASIVVATMVDTAGQLAIPWIVASFFLRAI